MPEPQEQDGARPILDPLPVDHTVKRAAWDAFHKSSSPEEFRAYFDKAPIPQESKRALWDAKFGGTTQTGAASLQQPALEQPKPQAPTGKDWLKSGTWLPKLSRTLGQTADWAEGKRDTAEEANLHEVATTGKSNQPIAAFTKGAGYDLLMRAARKASGFTSPAGLATAVGVTAAPEIVGPAMVAHGLFGVASNARDAVQGNPEAVDAALSGAAEAVGGGATAGEGFAGGRGVSGTLQQTNTARLLRAGQDKITRMQLGEAPKTLTQAIQPGVNIPRAQESIGIAGPRIQQLRQAGAIRSLDGEPVTEIKNTEQMLDATRAAKKAVLDGIEQRLGPVADLQPDVSSVAKAMRGSVDKITAKQFKGVRGGIEQRAAAYDEGGFTLRDIENRIQAANKSLRGFYKQTTPNENPNSVDMDATLAEVKALRDLLDDKVNTLSGDGVKDLKREYGALRDVERATARQHAIKTRTKEGGLWEGLAYLHAAGDLMTGNLLGAAKAGAALTVGNMLTKLRDPNFLIEQSFHGPKAFRAAEAIPAHAGPPEPAGLLGAPATEVGFTQTDISGSARDPSARWATPKAALPDEKPQVAKFIRVINKNQPRSPLGLLRESNTPPTNVPPMVDEKFARESVKPVQGKEWGDERRMGPFGEGGIRTTPKAQLTNAMTDRAHMLVRQTLDVMQSGDRPGRYYDENEMGEYNPQKEQSSSRGVTSGGRWRGVSSSRTILPWARDNEFTPSEMEQALRIFEKTGRMNRVMKSAMEYVKREEAARSETREPGEEEVPF